MKLDSHSSSQESANAGSLAEQPLTPGYFKNFCINLVFILSVLGVSAWIIGVYMEKKAVLEIFTDPLKIPPVEAVVVPGASVYRSGKLSPVLMERMDAAVAFTLNHPGIKLVLSGHVVPNGYNETKAMEDYAVERGVPQKDVLLDNHGRSTFVTLLNCKKQFKLNTILLVSQNYHLPRGLYITRRLGMKGYGLEINPSLDEEWNGREWASRFKDFFLVRVFKFFNAN